MKICLILFAVLIAFNPASAQVQPRITINEGQISDTTLIGINSANFGFGVDWGRKEQDTCRYEFFHVRGKRPFSSSTGMIIGKSVKFQMQDIRPLMPGDRLAFNLELNGQRFSRSYQVLSTKASLAKPRFFTISFIYNADTLHTDSYQAFLYYYKDSLTTAPPALMRDTFQLATRVYFSDRKQLPDLIMISFKGQKLSYEFVPFAFFHGAIFLSYTERKSRPKNRSRNYNAQPEYNAQLRFVNKDVDGEDFSQLSDK